MIGETDQEAFTERFGVEIVWRPRNVQTLGPRNIEELVEQTSYLLSDRVADPKAPCLFGALLIRVDPCPYQYEKIRFCFTAQQKLAVVLHLFILGSAQKVAFLGECCD